MLTYDSAVFVSCTNMVFITGSPNRNDGPKWTCGVQLLRHPCIVFSLGSDNVIDFEKELYKWGQCTIHVFDPTVDGSIAPSLKRQVSSVHR
jgi:hypothetical protein